MDVRTLFIAQSFALGATAAMFWIGRDAADRRNGARTWTLAITVQGLAYLLLANAGRLPVLLAAVLGNAAGAIGVALYFVALRQFLGRPLPLRGLGAMVLAVTAVANLAGEHYAAATIFNGFVYGALELLNGVALWRRPAAPLLRVQRTLALLYLLMGAVLPLRAVVLMLTPADRDYLNMPVDWQLPIYVFGFIYIVATNLGFLQMCRVRAESTLREQAMTDGLTGLPNRRALNDAMAHALAAAERHARPFAVLMLDLDHFKSVNDRLGHGWGDALLAAFARRLGTALRAQDTAYRYGGEEFCALLPETSGPGAITLAQRLLEQVRQPAQGEVPAITASIGVAVWRDGDHADALFGRADRALYRAKAAGRDQVGWDDEPGLP